MKYAKKPSPKLAMFLSFLIPGMGHFYINSQVHPEGMNTRMMNKAILYVIIWLIGLFTIGMFIGILITILVWISAIIDSKREAESYMAFRE